MKPAFTGVFVQVLLAVSVAVAQFGPSDVIVNVPFSFVVASHQMQPGRYVVRTLTDGVIEIVQSQDPSNRLNVPVHRVEGRVPKEAKLVFHRYGDSYFLAEVWTGASDIGREVFKSKAEKEIASRRVSGSRPKGEIAVLKPER